MVIEHEIFESCENTNKTTIMVSKTRRSIKSRKSGRKPWRRMSNTKRAQLVITKRARPNKEFKTYAPLRSIQPKQKRAVLPYTTSFVLMPTPSTNTHANFIVKLNSLYDPDYSAGGNNGQPYGFDQLCPLLYSKYYVQGAHITVKFSNTASQAYPIRCGLLIDQDTDLPSTINEKRQKSRGRTDRLLLVNSRETATVSEYVSMRHFFGTPIVGDDRKYGTVSADPADQCYAHCWVQSPGAWAGSYNDTLVEVIVKYYAVFVSPVDIGVS